MADFWSTLSAIFGYCWRIWGYEFTVGGFTFSLLDVAAVSVVIFVIGILLDVLLDGNWGA